MTFLPLRSRPTAAGEALCVNDSGRFFAAEGAFVDRLLSDEMSDAERAFLRLEGHLLEDTDDLGT